MYYTKLVYWNIASSGFVYCSSAVHLQRAGPTMTVHDSYMIRCAPEVVCVFLNCWDIGCSECEETVHSGELKTHTMIALGRRDLKRPVVPLLWVRRKYLMTTILESTLVGDNSRIRASLYLLTGNVVLYL
jgi:hypothetical protein